MSLQDGHLKRKDLYLTTSASFAAYLMLRGYELLGTVDEGDKQPNGKPKLYFGLTPTTEALLDSRLAQVEADIHGKFDEFENMWLAIPHDNVAQVNFKQFYFNTRACFRALDEAIRR